MKPVRCFIGWDQRDALAFQICEASLKRHASIPVEVIALKDWELRASGNYWRPYNVDERGQMWDERDGKPFSTNFSFTRFMVPLLEDYGDERVIFCDPDMLWRGDVGELLELSGDADLACVKHDHQPEEAEKMTHNIQTRYWRKNWSSLMVMKPSACRALTRYAVNNQTGAWLHGMHWIGDERIGSLPVEWNWLEGWSDPEIDPKIVHFTRGTPDMAGYEKVPFADEYWDYYRPHDLAEAAVLRAIC